MSIESELTLHIMAGMATAYPDIDPNQILVIIADGTPDYGTTKGKKSICDEVLKAEVVVATEEPIDRLPFMREFKRRSLVIGGDFKVFQEYKGHRFRNFVETLGYKGTALKLEYKHSISEV